MDDLRKALVSVAASMQALAASTTANTQGLDSVRGGLDEMGRQVQTMSREIQMMADRNRQTEQTVRDLQGTFASIEIHLVRLFERDAETQIWKEEHTRQFQDLVHRIEALEQKQSPAA